MTDVRIPATLDDAVAELTGLGELLTAKEWSRAAILASFVSMPGSGGDHRANRSSEICSASDFAALKITGLSSSNTVERYVRAWLDEHDGRRPEPGTVVVLPTKAWPPADRNAGSRTTANNIAEQIMATPALAKAAAVALIDGAVVHLDRREVHDLARSVDAKLAEFHHHEILRESPPRPEDDERVFWVRVRLALDLLLDAQVRISAGATAPPDVALRMQVLIPSTDWDRAVLDEIGPLS